MKFELDLGARWPIIRSYGVGEFRIAEQRHTTSLVLAADQIRTDFLPEHAGLLSHAHLDALCDFGTDLLVIGMGARSSFLAQSLLARVLARGVGCEVMSTPAACRSYNVLVSEGRSVAAALFLITPD